ANQLRGNDVLFRVKGQRASCYFPFSGAASAATETTSGVAMTSEISVESALRVGTHCIVILSTARTKDWLKNHQHENLTKRFSCENRATNQSASITSFLVALSFGASARGSGEYVGTF